MERTYSEQNFHLNKGFNHLLTAKCIRPVRDGDDFIFYAVAVATAQNNITEGVNGWHATPIMRTSHTFSVIGNYLGFKMFNKYVKIFNGLTLDEFIKEYEEAREKYQFKLSPLPQLNADPFNNIRKGTLHKPTVPDYKHTKKLADFDRANNLLRSFGF